MCLTGASSTLPLVSLCASIKANLLPGIQNAILHISAKSNWPVSQLCEGSIFSEGWLGTWKPCRVSVSAVGCTHMHVIAGVMRCVVHCTALACVVLNLSMHLRQLFISAIWLFSPEKCSAVTSLYFTYSDVAFCIFFYFNSMKLFLH